MAANMTRYSEESAFHLADRAIERNTCVHFPFHKFSRPFLYAVRLIALLWGLFTTPEVSERLEGTSFCLHHLQRHSHLTEVRVRANITGSHFCARMLWEQLSPTSDDHAKHTTTLRSFSSPYLNPSVHRSLWYSSRCWWEHHVGDGIFLAPAALDPSIF